MNLQSLVTLSASLFLIGIVAACTCNQGEQVTGHDDVMLGASGRASVGFSDDDDDDDSSKSLDVTQAILEASHDISAIHSYLTDSAKADDELPSIERYQNMPEPLPIEPESRAGRQKVLEKRDKYDVEPRRRTSE